MNLRNDYPRPQFEREKWQNLNGQWQFEFADREQGKPLEKYFTTEKLTQEITVPYVYQAKLSGINCQERHEHIWYKRTFSVSKKAGKTVILHFGAVDYYGKVFVNGQFVGEHEGGHTSFSFEIQDYLVAGAEQLLTVYAFDPVEDESILRGKQFWEEQSRGIWYTNSSGIWQTVWLEEVNQQYLNGIKFDSRYDEGMVDVECEFSEVTEGTHLTYQVSFKEQKVAEGTFEVLAMKEKYSIDVVRGKIFNTSFHEDGISWTPESPNLFDIQLVLQDKNGQIIDQVQSYFGYRKIHTEKGMVFLNNRPYYQKLVLDQGYWPEGLLTAPTDGDFKKDILLAKEMGFNGCRKHQKTEDPRFLYHADQLGFLVWGECASAPMFTETAAQRLIKEWMEIIQRDYNHPSIVTWVPLNESWGVPGIHLDEQQQHLSETMYHLLHTLDRTRLVISNDGWEATVTDICAIHDYSHGKANEQQKYADFQAALATTENLLSHAHHRWSVYAQGYQHQGAPILLTEFGGIGFQVDGQKGWGYTSVETETDYLADYRRIMEAVFASKGLWGYCYTQLTDVEQEINGILSYDRQPKCDLAAIRELNEMYHPERLVRD
ncbi:glycoside hydrolase family 2 protein [Carnobacterium gallinarum]|uniref:glycoside hydrolase family 2 protein n=1 Tax=Carnobacterium gallinarum TaxID=2749 RepID=UPI00054F757A|nr:glycoside hydrolase family 2 [Carnobacterium gallinarum]